MAKVLKRIEPTLGVAFEPGEHPGPDLAGSDQVDVADVSNRLRWLRALFFLSLAAGAVFFYAIANGDRSWATLRLSLLGVAGVLYLAYVVALARLADKVGLSGGGWAAASIIFPIAGLFGYSAVGSKAREYLRRRS